MSLIENTLMYIENRIKKMQKTVNEMNELNENSSEDLLKILTEANKTSAKIRDVIIEENDGYFISKMVKSNNIIAEVINDNKAILKLKFPNLISSKYASGYEVYYLTKQQLDTYYLTTEKPVISLEKKILIYKRYTSKLNATAICDNDNFEMKRVTNAICDSLFFSDNIENLSFIYTTTYSDVDYCEATLIYAKDLDRFINYIVS